MNGGSKIIDLHVSDVEYAAADEPLQLTEPYEGEVFEQPEEPEERSDGVVVRDPGGNALVLAA